MHKNKEESRESHTFSPDGPGGPRGPIVPSSPTVPFEPLSPSFPLLPGLPYLIMADDNRESLSRAAMRRCKAYLVSNLSKATRRTLDAFHSLPKNSCPDTAMETESKTNSHTPTNLNPTVSFVSFFSFKSSAALRRKNQTFQFTMHAICAVVRKPWQPPSARTLPPLNPSNPFIPSTPSSPWQG